MTFALYKGATKVWQETQSVDVENGVFNVLLGKITPLDTVRFNTAIDLGIKVGGDLEMTPRTPLAGAAYAKALPGFYTFYRDDLSGNKSYNIIGGAGNNTVAADVTGATISGGGGEPNGLANAGNRASGDFATVGGGAKNWITGGFSVIGGGVTNTVGGIYSTVGGGNNNTVSGAQAVVAGGAFNAAYGNGSTIGGGDGNVTAGVDATVPGGSGNRADGAYSFAAGYKARAKHEGSFVWNDRSVTSGIDSLLSTAANQFIIRAANGVGINKAPTSLGIHLKQAGSNYNDGIRLEKDDVTNHWDTYMDNAFDYNWAYDDGLKSWIDDADGAYYVFSDATLKEDIRPFEPVLAKILQLNPSTYRFKNAAASAPRSLGLVAQEVAPRFPELVSEKDGLLGVNYSGLSVVNVEAIQELYILVKAQQERLDQQEAEIASLKSLREP